jgi:hypothetical protein
MTVPSRSVLIARPLRSCRHFCMRDVCINGQVVRTGNTGTEPQFMFV